MQFIGEISTLEGTLDRHGIKQKRLPEASGKRAMQQTHLPENMMCQTR